MCSLLLLPGILYDLFHSQIMLNTSIYARKKCLLHSGINEFVLNEEGGEAGVKEEVEGLANTSAEGNHPEVGGVCGITLLVDEFDH